MDGEGCVGERWSGEKMECFMQKNVKMKERTNSSSSIAVNQTQVKYRNYLFFPLLPPDLMMVKM